MTGRTIRSISRATIAERHPQAGVDLFHPDDAPA